MEMGVQAWRGTVRGCRDWEAEWVSSLNSVFKVRNQDAYTGNFYAQFSVLIYTS